MHGQLGKADVHGAHRYQRAGDAAQGGAAGQVGAVGHQLHRYACLSAGGAEHGTGAAIRGVALVGVEFDDHAAVHAGAVASVGVFGVIGVDGVGIVGGYQKAAGQGSLESLLILPQGQADAAQGVPQECGGRALLGGGAHLLVVEDAQHRQAAAVTGGEEALCAAPDAGQVVQLGGEDVLAVGAQHRAAAAAVEEQVLPQHVLRTDAGGLRGQGQDGGVGVLGAEQGNGVDVGLILHAVIGIPVHVDGHAGDHQQVTVYVHQLFRDGAVFPHEQAARHGQGAIEPRGHQHAAVFLGVQADVAVVPQLRVLLELEGRGVTVGRGHHEAAGQLPGYAEGEDAGAVAGDEVPAAGSQSPAVPLGQGRIALRSETGGQIGHHMVAAGAGGDEVQQRLDGSVRHREEPPLSSKDGQFCRMLL